VATNMHDFSKLLENMPANLSDLARAADVSERSIMRMRDGESVLRGTANKVLRGLSQIYDQKFTLDNVTGINIYEK
jgi:predicted transcriptional regulator